MIGDAVNTAARLEGLTKDFDHAIIASEAVRAGLPANAVALGPVEIRGRSGHLEVFGVPA